MEKLRVERESPSRIELELELHRCLPAVKQVLIEDIIDPASHIIKDAGTLLELEGDKLAKHYLNKFKLFGAHLNSELREVFLARLADTQLPGKLKQNTHDTHSTLHATAHTYRADNTARVAVKVASELLELTRPTGTEDVTSMNVEGANKDDEVYDTAGWSDDKKCALSAIVRFLAPSDSTIGRAVC
jgi:hypothetical protein